MAAGRKKLAVGGLLAVVSAILLHYYLFLEDYYSASSSTSLVAWVNKTGVCGRISWASRSIASVKLVEAYILAGREKTRLEAVVVREGEKYVDFCGYTRQLLVEDLDRAELVVRVVAMPPLLDSWLVKPVGVTLKQRLSSR